MKSPLGFSLSDSDLIKDAAFGPLGLQDPLACASGRARDQPDGVGLASSGQWARGSQL